jgi:hypothetical protein
MFFLTGVEIILFQHFLFLTLTLNGIVIIINKRNEKKKLLHYKNRTKRSCTIKVK